MADKPKSMMEKVDVLFQEKEKELKEKEAIDIKKSKKGFRIPRKIRMGAKKKIKQSKAIIFWVSDTGNMNPEWCKIEEGAVYNKRMKVYYPVTHQYLINFMGKYPCMIVPENSIKPISKEEILTGTKKEIDLVFAQQFVVKIAQMEALDLKKKGIGGGKFVIFYIVGGVVVLYMIMKALGLNI